MVRAIRLRSLLLTTPGPAGAAGIDGILLGTSGGTQPQGKRIVVELRDKIGAAGSWEASSAQRTLSDADQKVNDAVLALLTQLHDKSLVIVDRSDPAGPRYRTRGRRRRTRRLRRLLRPARCRLQGPVAGGGQ